MSTRRIVTGQGITCPQGALQLSIRLRWPRKANYWLPKKPVFPAACASNVMLKVTELAHKPVERLLGGHDTVYILLAAICSVGIDEDKPAT